MNKILESLFGWVTTDGSVAWQKIAALLVVGFFGLIGYIIYDQRSYITAQLYTTVSRVEYSIAASATPAVLRDLMRDTGALAAMAWEFDWATNQRRLVVSMSRDGQELLKGLDILSIVRPNSVNNPAVINALFDSQHACINIDNDSSADIRMVKANIPEVTVYCISGLRTMYGEVRGAITVFLPKAPADQVVIGAKLRSAAERILTRR